MRWLLVFFLPITLFAQSLDIVTEVERKTHYIDDPIKITYLVPRALGADSKAFLAESKAKSFFEFELDDITSTTENDRLAIVFSLFAKKTGSLTFFPGFLPLKSGRTILLSPVSIDIRKSRAGALDFVPGLSLYPDERVELSVENALKLVSEEALEKRQIENRAALFAYHVSWALLVGFLVAIGFTACILWMLYEYEVVEKVRQFSKPRVDPEKKWRQIAKDQSITTKERWHALFLLIKYRIEGKELHKSTTIRELLSLLEKSKIDDQEKKVMKEICFRIDAVSYAGLQEEKQEVERYLDQLPIKYSAF